MERRIAAIWFPHLLAERMIRRRPYLRTKAFVLATPHHGRMHVTAASIVALNQGVCTGMAVADARALVAGLLVLDDEPGRNQQLLTGLGLWCIRYTPVTAIDLPEGLFLDITGCAHLWGGEATYAADIQKRLQNLGYTTRIAVAGTAGTAWALCHYGKQAVQLVPPGEERAALLKLPPAALRLEPTLVDRLQKLGLFTIGHFIDIGRSILRRRFGTGLLDRMDQAIGWMEESLEPLQLPEPFQEWLPCPDLILTRTGIEIALQQLLNKLCDRLVKEGKGLRKAILKAYRIDGGLQQIEIGTHLPSQQTGHLFRLFELKIEQIAPALGIELFILEAPVVEKARLNQEAFWRQSHGKDATPLAELLDQLTGKLGRDIVQRYMPAEHFWPERAVKIARELNEQPDSAWPDDRPRPLRLLSLPEPVEVTAPIPDYPPMHFRHKGQLHTIKKADGPERIEQEWWIEEGEHRDYYVVENDKGERFWLFRLGHYTGKRPHQWFLHGYFA